MILIQLHCHLVDEYKTMAAKEQQWLKKNHIFGSPGRTPGVITTKIRGKVYGKDLHPCAKFCPNPFSSFAGFASQTDRQTYTNSKHNLPHNRGGDNYVQHVQNSARWDVARSFSSQQCQPMLPVHCRELVSIQLASNKKYSSLVNLFIYVFRCTYSTCIQLMLDQWSMFVVPVSQP